MTEIFTSILSSTFSFFLLSKKLILIIGSLRGHLEIEYSFSKVGMGSVFAFYRNFQKTLCHILYDLDNFLS